MIKGSRRNRTKRRNAPYFNFGKFEKLLDNLQQQGINVTAVDYPVKNLKKYNKFKYFFENFTEQQIKTQLTFYSRQFDDEMNDLNSW